jgi:hypothetical protein
MFLAEGIDLIIPNFLLALDFCFFVSRQRSEKGAYDKRGK